jgi:hypothetical protein
VYLIFLCSGSLFAVEEKTLVLGASFGWDRVQERSGVSEMAGVRPHTVLALSSAKETESPLDMALSFDETSAGAFRDSAGHYSVSASLTLAPAGRRWARIGDGAALFSEAAGENGPAVALSDDEPLIIVPRSKDALLASGRALKDFSMEFWLYPLHAENGEQVLSWTAVRTTGQGQSILQRIQCSISANRLRWIFQDFFTSPDDGRRISLSLTSSRALIPQTWSHHLIRFDSDTGMLEYLVDGRGESIDYASSSGREGGEVYLPVVGNEGRLVLGGKFTGFMDEFRVYGNLAEPLLTKYPPGGGYFVSDPIELGATNSSIVKIDISAGRFSVDRNVPAPGGVVRNVFAGLNPRGFPDYSALHCFVRVADTPYLWKSGGPDSDGASWIPFAPGSGLGLRGRWVQVAVQLYPSGDGETTPYVDELRIQYLAGDAPPPPAWVQVQARDGAVDISWRPSSAPDVAGYFVYYGVNSGEYFGNDAILGVSPINIGRRTSIRIDGLENGRLYFFAVAAYDEARHIGEFSRETAARPLRMVP